MIQSYFTGRHPQIVPAASRAGQLVVNARDDDFSIEKPGQWLAREFFASLL
jgi:hypothetical protein